MIVTWTTFSVACLRVTKSRALGALSLALGVDHPGPALCAFAACLAACSPGAPGGDNTVNWEGLHYSYSYYKSSTRTRRIFYIEVHQTPL